MIVSKLGSRAFCMALVSVPTTKIPLQTNYWTKTNIYTMHFAQSKYFVAIKIKSDHFMRQQHQQQNRQNVRNSFSHAQLAKSMHNIFRTIWKYCMCVINVYNFRQNLFLSAFEPPRIHFSIFLELIQFS